MHLDLNIYKLIIILMILFIVLIITVRKKVRPKKMINRVNMETFTVDTCIDVYDALKEYKMVNIHYTFGGIFIYLFCNLFVFLYLRYLCIGQEININMYIQKWSISFLLSFAFFIFTLSIGLYIINILYYKEFRKLHFYLIGNETYLKIVNEIHDHKYDSLIIHMLENRFGSFLHPIVIPQSIDEYYNFNKRLKVSNTEVRIQKFLRYYYEKNRIFKYILNFFYLKILGFITLSLPKWMRVSPEILLVVAILYDIKNNVLYSIFYMSIIYLIFINIRKIKEFYIETDPVSDEEIHNYLYDKGELFEDDMSFGYIEQYIKYNYKYWVMVDHPSRGPWHELRTKENIADKYLSLLWLPFIYLLFYQDSYTIFIPAWNLFIPCFIFLLPILLSKYIFVNKIFNFQVEVDFHFASYNKYWYIFLWVLIWLQYGFYFILFYKNCFLFSASETIFNNLGITINQNFSIAEKAKFVLDYINFYLPTQNILNPAIIVFYSKEVIDVSDNLTELRSTINLAFNNYNIQGLKIDTYMVYVPLPEIFIFIRNSLLFSSIIVFLKYVVTQYEIIKVSLKIMENQPKVMYEVMEIFIKNII